jgi:hypothetical protein
LRRSRNAVVVEVAADERFFGVTEDALERAVGRGLDRFVDFGNRGRLLGDELEVDDRDVRGRHADRGAVELALEVRKHQADSLGGAGGGRDHRERCRAGAVEVLVHRVERRLVTRVGVDRGHEAMIDADRVVEDLDDRN